jgi:hypothetical protein
MGVPEIALDGVAIPAEIEFGPARKVVLVLGLFGLVGEVAIVNGFSVANVVDARVWDHGGMPSACVLFVSFIVRRSSISPTFPTFSEAAHAGLLIVKLL